MFVCCMYVDGQKIAKSYDSEIRSLLQEFIAIQDSLQADAMCTSEALDPSMLRAYLTVARCMKEMEL